MPPTICTWFFFSSPGSKRIGSWFIWSVVFSGTPNFNFTSGQPSSSSSQRELMNIGGHLVENSLTGKKSHGFFRRKFSRKNSQRWWLVVGMGTPNPPPKVYMANTTPPPLPCKSWEADMGGYRSHCWKGFFWKVILGLQSRRFDWEISGGCKPPKY